MNRRIVRVAVATALVAVAFSAFVSSVGAQTTHGIVVVNTSFLNVRAGPGINFPVNGVVVGGTELSVTGVTADGNWWGVDTSFGAGFVYADLVLYRGDPTDVPIVSSSSVAASSGGSVVVLASALNVRDGPSINFNVLGVVQQGQVMSVIGQDSATGWYNVNSPFGAGWVANSEVSLTGVVPGSGGGGSAGLTTTTTTSTGVGSTVVASAGSATGTTTVAEEQLRFVPTGFAGTGSIQFDVTGVYHRPHFGAVLLGRLVRDNTVTVMGRNGDASFILIDSPYGPGWVQQDSIRLPLEVFALPVVNLNPQLSLEGKPHVAGPTDISSGSGLQGFTTHDPVVVHNRPQLEAPAIGSLGSAVTATAIGRDFNLQFYQINTPFGVGWVRVDHDMKLNRGSDPFLLPITAVNGIPVGAVTAVTTTTTSGSTTTTTTSGSIAGPRVIVNTPNQNLRAGAGPNFAVITVVTGGSEFAVTGKLSDASWYRVNTPFGEGWLYAEFLIFRGDPSGVPIVSS